MELCFIGTRAEYGEHSIRFGSRKQQQGVPLSFWCVQLDTLCNRNDDPDTDSSLISLVVDQGASSRCKLTGSAGGFLITFHKRGGADATLWAHWPHSHHSPPV